MKNMPKEYNARRFRKEEDPKLNVKAEVAPIPLAERHKYVFYGGKPVKRNTYR